LVASFQDTFGQEVDSDDESFDVTITAKAAANPEQVTHNHKKANQEYESDGHSMSNQKYLV
jgi:hypothetical protein